MKKLILALALTSVVVAPALAQTMPPPRSAPRTPVHREALAERRATPPREVQGKATIIDGERLRVDNTDLRLFGIVPPQLSASFGPQARATLDQLVGGELGITCQIRDRDHDGRLLATCQGANGVDPALDLLRRGLAVAARGSISDTELAQPYIAAEQAAQAAKIGLWSVAIAAPAAPAAPAPAPVVIEAQKTENAAAKAAPTAPVVQPAPVPAITKPVPAAPVVTHDKSVDENPDSFARFQILIAGILMLATTLSIIGAIAYRRYTEKRDEMKALAAALRGELQAARAVCLTRVKNIATEEDDQASTWPRIRATLYQAYVGRLGWLGAELARQVASIYGQASDYASYYNNLGDSTATAAMPKKQALQALVTHIDEVLPRLAMIEQTGRRIMPHTRTTAPAPIAPMPEILRRSLPKPLPLAATPEAKPEPEANATPEAKAAESAPAAAAVETPSAVADIFGESKLLSLVRNLRERFAETQAPTYTVDEPMTDYATLIEEETERYSFMEDEDDSPSHGKTGSP